MKFYALLAALLLVAFPLAAQDSDESSRGPDGRTHYFVDGITVLPVPGKPFSGRSTTEWTRTLEDGSTVTTHLFAMVVRDSEGRIYRERHQFVPTGGDRLSPMTAIRIFDPITHTRTDCEMATHQCEVTSYHAKVKFTPQPVGPFDDGKRFLSRETLGNDVLDGTDVTHTRETVTIQAGAIGNSQQLSITREFWYSPDLEINLAIVRKDPREGVQNIRVSELSRSEPDGSLFKIPPGFHVDGGETTKP